MQIKYKYKNIIFFLVKIFFLSLFLVILYILIDIFFFQKNDKNIENKTNNKNNLSNFKNLDIDYMFNIWVAISSNIWIRYTQKQNNGISYIYEDIFNIEDILKNGQSVKEIIFTKNIKNIIEYYNFLRSDFKKIIDISDNKKTSIENIIKQLEIRKNKLKKSIYTSSSQLEILIDRQKINTNNINLIKKIIQETYLDGDSKLLISNLDKYYIMKNELTIINTYILYISWIRSEYNKLLNYCDELNNALTINIDIISKWSYIVIPDAWTKLLEKFQLIISEEDYIRKLEQTDK